MVSGQINPAMLPPTPDVPMVDTPVLDVPWEFNVVPTEIYPITNNESNGVSLTQEADLSELKVQDVFIEDNI